MEEERLDKIIMQRELFTTRARCEQVIEEFGVLVNGKLVFKPGKKFPVDAEIELIAEEIPWVSRGALKLIRAIENWDIDFKGKVVLDIGASTGGFTEVALDRGATKVFAIDVGKDQLHESLKNNPNVISFEKTHVRELTHNQITEPVDICVIDVSFISIQKVFPFIQGFLKPGASVIALIKPQFEVGKENIGKNGIVKNKGLYPTVLYNVRTNATESNFTYHGHTDSPILGGDGNKEFLMYLTKN